MDRCQYCERPDAMCECCNTACEPTNNTTFKRDGGRGEIPAVNLHYGSINVPGVGLVESGWQSSTFQEFDDAVAFADFLNSDAIFDCVIPARFLRSENRQ